MDPLAGQLPLGNGFVQPSELNAGLESYVADAQVLALSGLVVQSGDVIDHAAEQVVAFAGVGIADAVFALSGLGIVERAVLGGFVFE